MHRRLSASSWSKDQGSQGPMCLVCQQLEGPERVENQVTASVGCGGLRLCGATPPAQPLRREWGYQVTSQRASEAAWEARQVPEGLSCPFVHGATQDEGSRCQAPGRRWRDPRHVCLRASARGSELATRVGCRSWGL